MTAHHTESIAPHIAAPESSFRQAHKSNFSSTTITTTTRQGYGQMASSVPTKSTVEQVFESLLHPDEVVSLVRAKLFYKPPELKAGLPEDIRFCYETLNYVSVHALHPSEILPDFSTIT